MARERPEEPPSWSDLPRRERRRLTILLGRLAMRRLPMASTGAEAREAAHEGDVGVPIPAGQGREPSP
jgi:hypothetical protein